MYDKLTNECGCENVNFCVLCRINQCDELREWDGRWRWEAGGGGSERSE